MTDSEETVDFGTGPESVRQVILTVPQTRTILALTHAPSLPVGPGGLNHLGLVLESDEEVTQMVQRVPTFGGVVQKQGRREGAGIAEAFAYVRDPDGYAIELSTQALLYRQLRERKADQGSDQNTNDHHSTDVHPNSLRYLNETEQSCLCRRIALVRERLRDNVVAVWLFGSAARGDMWSSRSPMHSDIDLLILTREPIAPEMREELVNDTYPLFLECGRQIGPQWRTVEQWASSKDEPAKGFKDSVEAEGRILYQKQQGG
jgi:predicted nucleotidyltransferase